MKKNPNLESIVADAQASSTDINQNNYRLSNFWNKTKSFFNKAKNNAKKGIIIGLTPVVMLAYGMLKPPKAGAAEPFGYVHTQFSLNDFGYGTAGSDDPDVNYFHTTSGIEVRDSSGNYINTRVKSHFSHKV